MTPPGKAVGSPPTPIRTVAQPVVQAETHPAPPPATTPPPALEQPPAPTAAAAPAKPSSKTPPPPLRPLATVRLRPDVSPQAVGLGGPNPFLTMPPPLSQKEEAERRLNASLAGSKPNEQGASAPNGVVDDIAKRVGGNPASGTDVSFGVSGTLDIVRGRPKVVQLSVDLGGKTPLGGMGVKAEVIAPPPKSPPPKP